MLHDSGCSVEGVRQTQVLQPGRKQESAGRDADGPPWKPREQVLVVSLWVDLVTLWVESHPLGWAGDLGSFSPDVVNVVALDFAGLSGALYSLNYM